MRLFVVLSALLVAMSSKLTRRDIFEQVERLGGVLKATPDSLIPFLEKKCDSELHGERLKNCKHDLRRLMSRMKHLWNRANRHREHFVNDNQVWLDDAWEEAPLLAAQSDSTPASSQRQRGRPVPDFSALRSADAKRKATAELTRHTSAKLLHAAKRRARSEGRSDLSYVLEKATATPTRPTKLRRLMKRPASVPRQYSTKEALALFIDARHSKSTWQFARLSAKIQGADIYPTYKVRSAKEDCYPADIRVEENGMRAEVGLQSLLDHTAKRIVQLQENVIRQTAGEIMTKK